MTAYWLFLTLMTGYLVGYLLDAFLMAHSSQRFAEQHGVQALRQALNRHQVFPGLHIWLETKR
ncbi:hypothetical protein [uncultured Pseudomonas sp.]|uniref:hypothetical protein n=1 Tax=uncultured Pseudomonas sp. TaxID=114707 RepID=UPI0025FBD715|nr:hypothetical protein [uncultured Pseudomonas sp.]